MTEIVFPASPSVDDTHTVGGVTWTCTDAGPPAVWESGGEGSDLDAAEVSLGSFAKWNTAKARGSSAPARMAVIGDSNVMGYGSGTGTGGMTGAFTTNLTAKLATLLGYRTEHFFGDQNTAGATGTYNNYDSRVTLGTGWAADSGLSQVPGGRWFLAAGGSVGKLRFTPGASDITKFRLWYPTNAGLNTAETISIDGVLADTFTLVGSAAYVSRDVTVGAGVSHYIEIGGGATGNMYCAGIETFNNTDTPSMLQLGFYAALAADLNTATQPWSHRPASVTLAPDYSIVYCTINDTNAATTISTYYAAMQALVAALDAVSDGCLVVGYPSNTNGTINGYLDQVALLLRGLAQDYDWAFVDARSVLGHSNAKASALSYRYDDAHPNSAGAQALADLLYAALGPSL